MAEPARATLPGIIASRCTPERAAEGALKFMREVERFTRGAPEDARLTLRRLAGGDLGRVPAPRIEQLAQFIGSGSERMTGAIASVALIIGGSLIVSLAGWHRLLGNAMIIVGLFGTLAVAAGAWRNPRRERGER